ncbi:hypothetical protein MRX96_011851 [Rhipicephalus microplus]
MRGFARAKPRVPGMSRPRPTGAVTDGCLAICRRGKATSASNFRPHRIDTGRARHATLQREKNAAWRLNGEKGKPSSHRTPRPSNSELHNQEPIDKPSGGAQAVTGSRLPFRWTEAGRHPSRPQSDYPLDLWLPTGDQQKRLANFPPATHAGDRQPLRRPGNEQSVLKARDSSAGQPKQRKDRKEVRG